MSTVNSAKIEGQLTSKVTGSTGAVHSLGQSFLADMKNSGDAYIFDRVFALKDYSLTVAAGNLDIDLYDLGTLDAGAGAGRDNLGLDHANARIVAIGIRHQEDGNGGSLRIDQNGVTATAWEGLFNNTTVLDLAEGAFVLAYLGESGKTVTDATDHVLRLSAQTGTCVLDLIFYSKQS